MRTRIDKGARTYLPLCSCGWRGVTVTSMPSAHRQAAFHELDQHAGTHRARNAARNHQRRHTENV